MEEMKKTVAVEMTAEERAAFEAYKAKKAREEKAQQRKENRAAYLELVDEQMEASIPELQKMSEAMGALKKKVFADFEEVISMKRDIMHLTKEGGQFSHTFINTAGDKRIILGNNLIDSYADTVEEGIGMIQGYITSLARDEETRALVSMVQRLLSKDSKGTLKASRVLQLESMAEKSGNETFIEGVRIIKEAYRPVTSSTYIRAQVKDEKTGAFVNIPLSMSDVE